MKLTLTNQSARPVDEPWLRRKLQALARLLKVNGQWSITIVDDSAMKILHNRTMKDPTTTDVLTFDLRDQHQGKRQKKNAIDLDTVVCRDVAARRARDLGHSVEQELLLYSLHSLLHVQGYDDTTRPGFERMHRREDALLIALGVGPLYHAQRRGKARPAGAKRKTKKKTA